MTQVSWMRQLGLAIALLLLGTAAFWLEYKHKPQQEAAEEQSKKLFAIKDTSVKSIRLSSVLLGAPDIVLNCLDLNAKLCKPGEQSKWQVVEPSQLRADDSNVNGLLSALNNLSSSEVITIKDETAEKKAALLKDYGLDPESRKSGRRVEIKTELGSTTLYLGATHPIGDGIFAIEEHTPASQGGTGKIDDSAVYLVSSMFKSNLVHDLSYWRDKKILTLSSNEIESFKLSGTTPLVSAEKKENKWVVKSSQGEFAGDADQINTLLSSASFLTAKGFAAEHKDDATFKSVLKGTQQRLSMTFQKEKKGTEKAPDPVILTLYSKKKGTEPEKLYATVSNLDPLFELDPNSLQKLTKAPKDLRLSRLITTMERFGAKRLELSGKPLGELPLILFQENGKWSLEKDKMEANQERVLGLLDKLSNSKIEEFLPTSLKEDPSAIHLKLFDEKNAAKSWIFWRKPSSGAKEAAVYVKELQTQKKETFLMDKALLEALPWSRDFLKKEAPQPSPVPEKTQK